MMKDSQDLQKPTIGMEVAKNDFTCLLSELQCAYLLQFFFTSFLLTSDDPIPYAVSNKHPQSGSKHKPNDKKRFGMIFYTILVIQTYTTL